MRNSACFAKRAVVAVFAAGSLCWTPLSQAAEPVYAPPYALLPNVLYVVPYAVSTQPLPPAAPAYPVAEMIISIGNVKRCKVQVEWIDWNGTTAGLSGPAAPPPPVPPSGSLQFHTQAASPPPLSPLPPYTLNVFSDLAGPFEGKANIRSDCKPSKKLFVDAGFEVIPAQGAVPLFKRVPVVRPQGNGGG